MRLLRSSLSLLLLGVLMTGTGPAANAVDPGVPAGKPVKSATVALVTGDLVKLTTLPDGQQAVTVRQPDGRPAEGYRTVVERGDKYVYPRGSTRYLDRFDKELFNVSSLVRQGFADRPLRLIATYSGQARTSIAPAGATKTLDLPSIGGVALTVERDRAKDFWTATAGLTGIDRVWLDATVRASLDFSVPQIGAPQAWQAGFDGSGVTVAVLDTGVDAKHPDLAGKVTEEKNFTTSNTVGDRMGHGTHVAATVAGSGGKKGVAPGAKLINGKVLGDDGSGTTAGIIAGMEWAAARARIVSMSLGSPQPSNGTDPLSMAVNSLAASTGALFVAAAGNHNPGEPDIVGAPAAADAALAVGAVDRADQLAPFSNVGPRWDDNAIKPEITAPGVRIAAARAAGTSLGETVDERYTRLSGTSMATPHVSGVAAILMQRNPNWKAAELKAAMMATAKPTDGLTPYQQGTGRVDTVAALNAEVRVDQATLSMGRYDGPYGNAKPFEREITYRNTGSRPLTVELKIGGTFPPGMVRLSRASLTLAPGATETVTLTVDLNKGDLGLYQGELAATVDSRPVARSVFNFEKDLRHKLRIKAVARDGRPVVGEDASVSALNLATGRTYGGLLRDGSVELVVPPGSYTVMGILHTMDASNRVPIESTAVAKDEVSVGADTAVELDTRAARDIETRVPDAVEPLATTQSMLRATADGAGVEFGVFNPRTVRKVSAVPMAPVRRGKFTLANFVPLQAPQLRMSSQPTGQLHPAYLGLAAEDKIRVDGRHQLPVVLAGAGMPGDFRDVRGKVALIQQSTVLSPAEQVRNAAGAGAAMAIVYAANPGLIGDLEATGLPIPGMELPHEQGVALRAALARHPVTLHIDGIAKSPYVYDMVVPTYQAIPTGLGHEFRRSDLVAVPQRMYSVRPNQFDYVTGFVAVPAMLPIGPMRGLRLPHEQVRYYATGKLTEGVSVTTVIQDSRDLDRAMAGPTIPVHEIAPNRTVHWFRGPTGPGLSGLEALAYRAVDKFLFVIPEAADSDPSHFYTGNASAAAARLLRNGVLVGSGPHAQGEFPAGDPGPASYRLELDITDGVAGWTYGKRSTNAWTFNSARPADGKTDAQPLLRARWDLDLDLTNRAKANGPLLPRLRVATQPGAPAAAISRARAWLSYDDGNTWTQMPMFAQGKNGEYVGVVWHRGKPGTAVSLRLDTEDVHGNRFEQTVFGAYGLA